MQNFKHILLVLESTDQAAKTAINYCKQISAASGASVTVIDVLKPIPNRWTDFMHSLLGKEADLTLRVKRIDDLEIFLKKHDAHWPVKLLTGTAVTEITQFVVDNKIDLVIKPQLHDDEQTFGSLAKQLVRKCPAAVMLVKAKRKMRIENIIAAIDPEPDDLIAEEVNVSILLYSKQISSLLQSSFKIYAAWHIFAESYLESSRMQIADDEIRKIRTKIKKERLAFLHQQSKTSGLELTDKDITLVKGIASRTLPVAINKAKCDLLILGSAGRVGVPGILIGNTAEFLLDTVKCSMLVLKPPGYKTPLKLER